MKRYVVYFCILAAVGAVAFSREYSCETIQFKSDFDLSDPMKIGLDAVSFMYPAKAEPDRMLAEIIFVKASKELQQAMEMKEPDVFKYLKTTFLGLTDEPDSTRDRNLLGNSVKAECFKHTFPTPSNIEAMYLTLKSGFGMMVAFRILPEMPEEDGVKFVDKILETMTELDVTPVEPVESSESLGT